MKIAAVTAEFNPLHLGHLRILEKARALSPDFLLVILNGSVTQRGELALTDKYTRARHALLAGADAVIELPQIFGAACAERFADAAVKLLAALPAEEKILLFGSEEGELAPLQNAAKILSQEPEEMALDLRDLLDMGLSYPAARAQAFSDYAARHGIPVADLTKPNNILAIEYLSSIEKRKGVTPLTVKREGDYDATTINAAAPSASAIRLALGEGKKEQCAAALPAYVAEDLPENSGDDLSPILLYHLSQTDAKTLSGIADVTEGIENRILRLAAEYSDSDSLVKAVSTKRYTEARVRRILIHSLLGVTRRFFEKEINAAPYYKVLGVKKSHTEVLSLFSRTATLLTGEEEAKQSGNACAALDAKAYDLYRVAKKATDLPDGMIVL